MGNLSDGVTVEIRMCETTMVAGQVRFVCKTLYSYNNANLFTFSAKEKNNLHDGILQGCKYETAP
jgi:hypothetical protein